MDLDQSDLLKKPVIGLVHGQEDASPRGAQNHFLAHLLPL